MKLIIVLIFSSGEQVTCGAGRGYRGIPLAAAYLRNIIFGVPRRIAVRYDSYASYDRIDWSVEWEIDYRTLVNVHCRLLSAVINPGKPKTILILPSHSVRLARELARG